MTHSSSFSASGDISQVNADDVMGWIDRNSMYEPTHDEAVLLSNEITELRKELEIGRSFTRKMALTVKWKEATTTEEALWYARAVR